MNSKSSIFKNKSKNNLKKAPVYILGNYHCKSVGL